MFASEVHWSMIITLSTLKYIIYPRADIDNSHVTHTNEMHHMKAPRDIHKFVMCKIYQVRNIYI